MIEIKEVCKQDYKKAQKFAIQGMHLDWYMDSKVILDLYAKYFWYMELNRATKVYGAYADDIFVGDLIGFSILWREKVLKNMMKRIKICISLFVKRINLMER